jgi:uncharacterized protein (TIGR00730 family)
MITTPNCWLTIFCGSSSGTQLEFTKDAFELGKWCAENEFGLVYGGASIGVMGAVAEGFLQNGAPVSGVIPTILKKREVAHFHLTELIETETMHERKALMMQRADAFIALPGGFGTLEELFEVITWHQLGIHQKPIFIFNQNGCYDSLIQLVNDMISNGFVRRENTSIYEVFTDLESLKKRLKRITPSSHKSIEI